MTFTFGNLCVTGLKTTPTNICHVIQSPYFWGNSGSGELASTMMKFEQIAGKSTSCF